MPKGNENITNDTCFLPAEDGRCNQAAIIWKLNCAGTQFSFWKTAGTWLKNIPSCSPPSQHLGGSAHCQIHISGEFRPLSCPSFPTTLGGVAGSSLHLHPAPSVVQWGATSTGSLQPFPAGRCQGDISHQDRDSEDCRLGQEMLWATTKTCRAKHSPT